MGKVLWHITMSLDGFIAAPDDDMAWLADYLGPNPTADQVLGQIGALLLGRRTYRLARTQEGRPYGGAWTGPMFVLTHDPPEAAAPGFTFLSGDVKDAVAAAKEAAGDDRYVVVLGANAAKQCLDAGVLDEVLVHLAPVLLGDGVRMFFRPGGTSVKLERIALTDSPKVTNLWLRVVR